MLAFTGRAARVSAWRRRLPPGRHIAKDLPHRVPGGRAQFFVVVYTAPPIYQAFPRIHT
jgi:hypothetical protein